MLHPILVATGCGISRIDLDEDGESDKRRARDACAEKCGVGSREGLTL